MTTSSQAPSRPACQAKSTLQSPKLPPRQFDPNPRVQREGQYIKKRCQEADAIRRTA